MTMQEEKIGHDREAVIEFVRRWGDCSSDAALDPECKIFTVPEAEGLVCYREGPGCVTVYGNPICPPEEMDKLTRAFNQHHQEKNTNIIYIAAAEKFVECAMRHGCRSYVEFGAEMFIDPFDDPREQHGDNASLVRRKVRHAIKEGMVVKEYLGEDEQIEQAIERVGIEWLRLRRGPQIHTSKVFLFANRKGKRWFYALQHGEIVGTLVLNELKAQQGWLINHVMFTSKAGHGCPEYLIVTALDTLRQEGCHFATFGTIPGKELGQIEGLGRHAGWLARKGYHFARKLFHLDGRVKFWEKYHPQSKPSFLIFRESRIGLQELRALSGALNVKLI